MEDPEFLLIKAVGAGGRHAFEQLVKKYQDSLLNFSFRYLGDRHVAEDITQEVFLRVFQRAREFEPKGRVRNWLFRIAYNLCANELKQQIRHRNVQRQLYANGRELFGRSSSDQSEGKEGELEEYMMALLRELPENQRATLLLRVNEDLSYLEISKVLNVSVAAVESLIFRARTRLKELMKTSQIPQGTERS
jgi:RNA polymerase sigma-70 factor (ECF subfamily)